MKKLSLIMGSFLLSAGLLAGCGAEEQTATEEPEQTNQETTEEVEEGMDAIKEAAEEAIEEPVEETDELGAEIDEEQPTTEENEAEPSGTSGEKIEASGTFNGLADPHTIEVDVNGEPTSFQVMDENIMKTLEGLNGGETIHFVYTDDGVTKEIVELKEVK